MLQRLAETSFYTNFETCINLYMDLKQSFHPSSEFQTFPFPDLPLIYFYTNYFKTKKYTTEQLELSSGVNSIFQRRFCQN